MPNFKSSLFWPLRAPWQALPKAVSEGVSQELPSLKELTGMFERLNVRNQAGQLLQCVAQTAKPKLGAQLGYEAQIAELAYLPTRPGHIHDVMNALVWGAFPKAKAALNHRHTRAVPQKHENRHSQKPAQRTREQDALALLDEGGIVVVTPSIHAGFMYSNLLGMARTPPSSWESLHERFPPFFPLIFGHGIYEQLCTRPWAHMKKICGLAVVAGVDQNFFEKAVIGRTDANTSTPWLPEVDQALAVWILGTRHLASSESRTILSKASIYDEAATALETPTPYGSFPVAAVGQIDNGSVDHSAFENQFLR